jgi:mannose-6-phosphate isomerase
MLHRHDVSPGDVMFLPSGRIHAIGAGNVILEVQQNSDTTYRVFDFNRPGLDGKPRELHVDASLESIDWEDAEPELVVPDGETLVHSAVFDTDRLSVSGTVPAAPPGRCAVLMAIDGEVSCADRRFGAGQLFLLSADAEARTLSSRVPVTVIRTMLPTRP